MIWLFCFVLMLFLYGLHNKNRLRPWSSISSLLFFIALGLVGLQSDVRSFPTYSGMRATYLFVALVLLASGAVSVRKRRSAKRASNIADQLNKSDQDPPIKTYTDVVGNDEHGEESAYWEGNDSLDDKPVVVTLIPGTGNPDAPWAKPTSDFSNALLEVLPKASTVVDFRWSGVNSHASRVAASASLQTHILEVASRRPEVRQICIGHSHGGTALYWALEDSAVEDILCGYAFLSTPFLQFKARRDLAYEFVLILVGLLLIAMPSSLAWFYWRFEVVYASIISGLLLVVFYPVFWLLKKAKTKWKAEANSFLLSLPVSRCSPNKALCVRTPGDEVTGGMTLVYLIGWLQAKSHTAATGYLAAVSQGLTRKKGPFREVIAQTKVLVVLSGTALWTGILTLFNPLLFLAAFGSDIARHSTFLQVTVEPTPPGKWTLLQLDWDDNSALTGSGLSHSSYEHSRVPLVLGQWIKSLSQLSTEAQV